MAGLKVPVEEDHLRSTEVLTCACREDEGALTKLIAACIDVRFLLMPPARRGGDSLLKVDHSLDVFLGGVNDRPFK